MEEQKEITIQTLASQMIPVIRRMDAVFVTQNFKEHKLELIRIPILALLLVDTFETDSDGKVLSREQAVKSLFFDYNIKEYKPVEEQSGFLGVEYDGTQENWKKDLLVWQEKLNKGVKQK